MKTQVQARRAGRIRGVALGVLAAVAGLTIALEVASAARSRVVRFHVAGTPVEMVTAYGSIWVAGHRGGGVYRINPRTDRISAHIQTNANACDIWAERSRIFVLGCEGDTAVRVIDPKRNKVVRQVTSPARLYAGSLWRFVGSALLRLDPKTHVVLKKFRHVESEVPFGFGYGSVWIGTYTTLTRIDAATNTRTLIALPGAKREPGPGQGFANPWRMAFARHKVWYGNPAGIYAINARTNTARLDRISIGPYPDGGNIDLVAGAGSVWAGTSEEHVVRIDPRNGRVVGHNPGGGGDIAVAYGSLWVTKPVSDSVWRVPIH